MSRPVSPPLTAWSVTTTSIRYKPYRRLVSLASIMRFQQMCNRPTVWSPFGSHAQSFLSHQGVGSNLSLRYLLWFFFLLLLLQSNVNIFLSGLPLITLPQSTFVTWCTTALDVCLPDPLTPLLVGHVLCFRSARSCKCKWICRWRLSEWLNLVLDICKIILLWILRGLLFTLFLSFFFLFFIWKYVYYTLSCTGQCPKANKFLIKHLLDLI